MPAVYVANTETHPVRKNLSVPEQAFGQQLQSWTWLIQTPNSSNTSRPCNSSCLEKDTHVCRQRIKKQFMDRKSRLAHGSDTRVRGSAGAAWLKAASQRCQASPDGNGGHCPPAPPQTQLAIAKSSSCATRVSHCKRSPIDLICLGSAFTKSSRQ